MLYNACNEIFFMLFQEFRCTRYTPLINQRRIVLQRILAL